MRLTGITALASAVITLLACDSAKIERDGSAADAIALDAPTERDAGQDARTMDGSIADADDDTGPPIDAGPADTGPGDAGADAAVCTMDDERECGGEGVVVGGTSRCRLGYQTCRGGCSDTCPYALDDSCDDNRPGALGGCEYGTDCTDCGPARLEWSGCIDVVGPIDEVCTNAIDDDCDGRVDEECG